MIRTLLTTALLLLLPTTNASLYERKYDGFCLPSTTSGFTTGYHYLLHHSAETPHVCSQKCDETNAVYEATHEFYRGFSHVKNGGDCYCFYDAGYLPPENAFEVVAWESVRGGDAQGEIGGGDGAEGVGCYRVIIRETVSFVGGVGRVSVSLFVLLLDDVLNSCLSILLFNPRLVPNQNFFT
jgi:hypothetical protein